MELKEIEKNVIELDGQTIYLINEDIINKLEKYPTIDGDNVGGKSILELLRKKVNFYNKYPEFKYGL